MLEGLGAGCVQKACYLERNWGLYCVEVLAEFVTESGQEPDAAPVVHSFSVTVAGKPVEHLTAVTAYRVWDTDMAVLTQEWTVRMEEQITGTEETTEVTEPFEVRLTRNGQTEFFPVVFGPPGGG